MKESEAEEKAASSDHAESYAFQLDERNVTGSENKSDGDVLCESVHAFDQEEVQTSDNDEDVLQQRACIGHKS